jgi:hypothetical protein
MVTLCEESYLGDLLVSFKGQRNQQRGSRLSRHCNRRLTTVALRGDCRQLFPKIQQISYNGANQSAMG